MHLKCQTIDKQTYCVDIFVCTTERSCLQRRRERWAFLNNENLDIFIEITFEMNFVFPQHAYHSRLKHAISIKCVWQWFAYEDLHEQTPNENKHDKLIANHDKNQKIVERTKRNMN